MTTKRCLVCLVLAALIFLQTAESRAGSVRMAFLQNDLHHLPLWVAQDAGFFEQEGVDVTIAGVFRAGPEIMTAFAAGALDMAYVGEAPATIAFARGNTDIRLIAQVNNEGSALVTAKNSPLNSVADLRGRTVAVPGNGSVQDFLLRRNLEKLGIAAGDVRIITIAPPEMNNALKNGQIDAYIAWQPYPARAVLADEGRILADSANLWPGHPCCALIVHGGVERSDADAVLRAHVRAIDYIRSRPEEAVRCAVRHTGLEEAVVREALAHVTYTPEPSLAGEEEYVRFLHRLGYIQADDSAAFVKNFINAAPLRSIQ